VSVDGGLEEVGGDGGSCCWRESVRVEGESEEGVVDGFEDLSVLVRRREGEEVLSVL